MIIMPLQAYICQLFYGTYFNITVCFFDESRCTTRALTQELVKEGRLCPEVIDEICKVFDGG
jgi:hypothetical protein